MTEDTSSRRLSKDARGLFLSLIRLGWSLFLQGQAILNRKRALLLFSVPFDTANFNVHARQDAVRFLSSRQT